MRIPVHAIDVTVMDAMPSRPVQDAVLNRVVCFAASGLRGTPKATAPRRRKPKLRSHSLERPRPMRGARPGRKPLPAVRDTSDVLAGVRVRLDPRTNRAYVPTGQAAPRGPVSSRVFRGCGVRYRLAAFGAAGVGAGDVVVVFPDASQRIRNAGACDRVFPALCTPAAARITG